MKNNDNVIIKKICRMLISTMFSTGYTAQIMAVPSVVEIQLTDTMQTLVENSKTMFLSYDDNQFKNIFDEFAIRGYSACICSNQIELFNGVALDENIEINELLKYFNLGQNRTNGIEKEKRK